MPSTENASPSEAQYEDDLFYIHHSDNPTTVLVSPPLTGDNYSSWLRAITMALRAKNKLGFVDDTIKQPEKTSPKMRQWERCNDLVSSWILNSVSAEIRGSILYANTARKIWVDLSERFSQTNAPKIYQLKQSISLLKQEDLSVSAYFTKLKSLWDELSSFSALQPCTCGNGKAVAESIQQDRAMEFLQGLHDRFATIRSQILLMEPFPNATKIYSLVRQEEEQQEIHSFPSPIQKAAALIATAKSTQTRQVTGGNRSHNKPRLHCDHCGRDNHTKDRCYKLIGYPPKKIDGSFSATRNKANSVVAPPPITREQYEKLVAMLASSSSESNGNLAGPINEEDDWEG